MNDSVHGLVEGLGVTEKTEWRSGRVGDGKEEAGACQRAHEEKASSALVHLIVGSTSSLYSEMVDIS